MRLICFLLRTGLQVSETMISGSEKVVPVKENNTHLAIAWGDNICLFDVENAKFSTKKIDTSYMPATGYRIRMSGRPLYT